MIALLLLLLSVPASAAAPAWRFAVSGDSRNCGDVVMPAIAKGARKDGAAFYWHLGDLRKIYDMDEDMLAAHGGKMTVAAYEKSAWDDFIAAQIGPFGDLPFFVGIGNHETIAPMTRERFLLQFADWLDSPVLRARRLADDASDRMLRSYFAWADRGVDFVYLDNATGDMFDDAQVEWFERELERDAKDPSIKSLVVGMHRALPNSFSCGHSMNESAQGVVSGRRVYRDLLAWRARTGKPAAVLASHSHFLMDRLYETPYWTNAAAPDRGVLPGWIVGTAGAVRYDLPKGTLPGQVARTGVYGYLLGEVAADGTVSYRFRETTRAEVPDEVVKKYGAKLVDACFSGNRDRSESEPAPSCSDK